ncbi:MAG: NPCBM/NEW2 domain-containing protein [Planctomycetota bacterium]
MSMATSRVRFRSVLVLLISGEVLTGASAQDKEVAVTRVGGAVVSGRIVGLVDGALELQQDGKKVTLARSDILALHGVVPRPEGAVTARLVGGDELRGELRGGDAAGETFAIDSRSLGSVSVPVDRLQALVVHRVAGEATVSEFVIPDDDKHDEALFLPARRGFDTLYGAIHRFTSEGVLFAPDGAASPAEYGLNRLAAVALRGGRGADRPAGALLVTRAADVLSVDLVRADAAGAELAGEGGRRFRLPWEEVATLLFRGDDRVFLADLQPEMVQEGSALGGDDVALYGWRRDRNVVGGFLVVGHRCYARGLGVHSRCALTYRVPEGFDTLCVAVGIDDSVGDLPARGDVDVAVLVDGRVVVERTGVRGGAAAELGSVTVQGGALVTLRVEFGAGLDLGDRVDWLHAVLVRRRKD